MAYEDDDQSFEALFSQAESNSITFEPQNVTDLMSTSSNRDFSRYVEEQENSVGKPKMIGCIPEVDLNIKEFRPIEKYFNEEPNQIYDDPSYYKKCLTGEGQSSQRLHGLLVKYLNCQDKKDKTVYRQQIVTAYWEFPFSSVTSVPSFL